jgi:hypothetical protein
VVGVGLRESPTSGDYSKRRKLRIESFLSARISTARDRLRDSITNRSAKRLDY